MRKGLPWALFFCCQGKTGSSAAGTRHDEFWGLPWGTGASARQLSDVVSASACKSPPIFPLSAA